MNQRRMSRFQILGKVIFAVLLAFTVAVPARAQEGNTLPLSEAGPYAVGTRDMTFTDESRDAQEIAVAFWYPAVEAADNAVSDLSGAPYPVILYSHGMYFDGQLRHRYAHSQLASHLASYGFVVVAVEHDDDMALVFVDRPLDILFVIGQLDRLAETDMSGLLNMEMLGMMGISGGTPTVLQMGGARLDGTYTDAWCTDHRGAYHCPPDPSIRETGRAVLEQFGTTDENGLKYIPTDPRIRAGAAMAPGFAPSFGERGLKTVSVPTLLMAYTGDEAFNYEEEAVFLYEHLGSADRYLISFIGGSHRTLLYPDPRRDHLMTAFFGYYLQGREDYAQYLTEDYVNSIEGLAWGPYMGE